MSAPARLWAGLALILTVTLSGAAAAEAPGATITRAVIASGATTVTGSGRLLMGTVGQAVIGASAAPAHAAAHGFWTFRAPEATAVDPPGGVLTPPTAIEFAAPTPNPSHGALAFVVGLPRPAVVSLLVLDLQGRAVSTDAARSLAAGRHRLVFDPASEARVASGIYFARLLVDGHVEGVQKFVRIR